MVFPEGVITHKRVSDHQVLTVKTCLRGQLWDWAKGDQLRDWANGDQLRDWANGDQLRCWANGDQLRVWAIRGRLWDWTNGGGIMRWLTDRALQSGVNPAIRLDRLDRTGLDDFKAS